MPGHENMFFAEKELCNGRLNDRFVDKHRGGSGPPSAQAEEEVVIASGGGAE